MPREAVTTRTARCRHSDHDATVASELSKLGADYLYPIGAGDSSSIAVIALMNMVAAAASEVTGEEVLPLFSGPTCLSRLPATLHSLLEASAAGKVSDLEA